LRSAVTPADSGFTYLILSLAQCLQNGGMRRLQELTAHLSADDLAQLLV